MIKVQKIVLVHDIIDTNGDMKVSFSSEKGAISILDNGLIEIDRGARKIYTSQCNLRAAYVFPEVAAPVLSVVPEVPSILPGKVAEAPVVPVSKAPAPPVVSSKVKSSENVRGPGPSTKDNRRGGTSR